jgi:hypothetical protein
MYVWLPDLLVTVGVIGLIVALLLFLTVPTWAVITGASIASIATGVINSRLML